MIEFEFEFIVLSSFLSWLLTYLIVVNTKLPEIAILA